MCSKKYESIGEKGAILLETALALPFLIYIAFMGFELTRLSELQLAKRDIIRVLSLSHVCGFRQSTSPGSAPPVNGDASVRCFQESINRVSQFTRDRFPQMQVYVQTYVIDDPGTNEYDAARRLPQCNQNSLGTLFITRIAQSPLPANFQTRVGLPQGRVFGRLSEAFNQDFQGIGMQFCLNGHITIAEFNVNRRPLFGSLGSLIGSSSPTESQQDDLHYEFGAI